MAAVQYENEKIWGKCQRDLTPTKRELEGIYKSIHLNKIFNKSGILLLVKSSKSPQTYFLCKIILLTPEHYQKCQCNKTYSTKIDFDNFEFSKWFSYVLASTDIDKNSLMIFIYF